MKENDPLCARYAERSVAEQNSLDLSWDLLMQDQYVALRDFLFPKPSDLNRFRQLVVNVSAAMMDIKVAGCVLFAAHHPIVRYEYRYCR